MATYDALQLSYWSQQEQLVQPSCIFRPLTPQAVSEALQILSRYQSTSNVTMTGCQFAIRGGGHTPFAGSANIEDGVTIDMSSIKAVDIAQSKTMVSVGAGARWSDVYSKLDAVGLAVAGGRVSNVGVSGLTTGGGMSYFAPRYGFVCDQVLNFEVALADGQIVNANATSRADLWFALKGGSNNFGIVTRFDLKAFPQGKIWGGSVYNPISTLPDQVQAFVEFNNATSVDTSAALINTYGYIPQLRTWTVSNLLVYTKPEVNPEVLRPFTGIKPQLGTTMRLTNLSDVTSEQVGNAPYGLRQLFLTRTYGNDADFLAQVFRIANTTLQSFAGVPGLAYALVYQPLPSAITSRAADSGGNPLGLDPASGPQVLAMQTIQWTSAADDALINRGAREIWRQADELAVERGLMRDWVYLNYAAPDQDPLGSYGEGNVRVLREVSRKYDPTGLFQTSVPGGFKLWRKNDG
ncbi:MAG: hypothetical protein LQ345_001216 [Seirophora villosa]|nr:MAG: hypothetical protein LQ345_001216 [Seirophora villosa]